VRVRRHASPARVRLQPPGDEGCTTTVRLGVEAPAWTVAADSLSPGSVESAPWRGRLHTAFLAGGGADANLEVARVLLQLLHIALEGGESHCIRLHHTQSTAVVRDVLGFTADLPCRPPP